MARAHETIKCVVQAGKDLALYHGDNLGCPDMVAAAKWLEDWAADISFIIGFDERRGIAAQGRRMPGPLDQLAVVNAVNVRCGRWGIKSGTGYSMSVVWAPLVVLVRLLPLMRRV
jgi:3-hexulose-6-phosphate synthase/6-phospho-3-hexuloisomerase